MNSTLATSRDPLATLVQRPHHMSTTASPRRSAWRWPAAGALAINAAIHATLIAPHLREAPYAGILFLALTIACLPSIICLLARDTIAVWAAVGSLALSAALAYIISRSIGLPALGDDIGHWFDPLGVVAVSSEAITALVACGVLVSGRSSGAVARSR
jgi:hypothetical protein